MKDSCFGRGSRGLMAVGLGRSISSLQKTEKQKSELESRKICTGDLEGGKVLLGASQQGKATMPAKGFEKIREKPAPRDPGDHSHRTRPVGPSRVLWTTRIPWAPHMALGMGRGLLGP